MKITTECPTCAKTVSVAAEHAGRKVRCPGCKGAVQIPGGNRKRRPGADAESGQGSTRKRPQDQQRPRKRKRPEQPAESHDDNIWSQPLRSVGEAIPEEDYEAYGIPQREKKERSRRGSGGGASGPEEEKYSAVLIVAAISGIAGLVGLGVSFASPNVGSTIALVGIVPASLGSVIQQWRVIGHANEEDSMKGFLCWAFAPYYMYFLFSRWEINKGAFLKTLLFSFAMAPGIVAFVVAAINEQGQGG